MPYATSSTPEILFSVGGRVCTFDRASLTSANIDILTTCVGCQAIIRAKETLGNAKDDRFCKMKIDVEAGTLVIVPGTGHDDFDNFEDECEDSSD